MSSLYYSARMRCGGMEGSEGKGGGEESFTAGKRWATVAE